MSHSRVDDVLALALARGLTVTDAAKEAGVSRATATRRQADEDFCSRVRQVRQELFDHATGQLADTLGEAVQALRCLLHSEQDSIRLRAATTLIAEAVHLHESQGLADRVEILEAWAKELARIEDDAEKHADSRAR